MVTASPSTNTSTSVLGIGGLEFKFKSMAFTIGGRALAEPTGVLVEVDLPFAALMFKDKAEKAITKNITRALQS